MIDLDELIAEADRLIADAEAEFVPVVLAKRQVGVRFVPMSGADWRELVLKHPPRPEIAQDLNIGYNVDSVVAAYPDLVLVDGDEVDDMVRPGPEGKLVSQWPAVWKRLTATGRKDVSTAIWAAHERTPERLVADAGKASPVSRKKKRS